MAVYIGQAVVSPLEAIGQLLMIKTKEVHPGGLEVVPNADGEPAGWYYDDFSEDVERCIGDPQRIAFSPEAAPPTGVRVLLDCGAETANICR